MSEKKKIFIIEDNKMYAELLCEYLEAQKKYQVKVFESGEACLRYLYEKPDFIILDYFLNGRNKDAMNGNEILDLIKKENENIDGIMLSAQEKYGVAAQSIAKGAVHYIIKDKDSFKEIQQILSASK